VKEVSYDVFSNGFHDAVTGNGTKRIPVDGMLELTRLCSLKCTHCYIGDARWKRDPSELSSQEIKDLLDALILRGTLWLCFTGGEAMSRPDFKDLWLYAKKKGFILTLFTNATLINRSMAQFLKENPPFSTEVSIYGATEETYERVTLVKGSYRRFMNGVENLRETGLPWRLKTVLIQENAHELEEMKALAETWGVQFKFDGNINPSIGEGKTGGKAPCASRVTGSKIVKEETEDPVRQSEAEDLFKRMGESVRKGRGDTLFSCGAGKNTFYINSSGNLQMCILTGHRGHSLRKGKTIAEAFDWGWDGFAKIREIKRRPDSPCRTCDIALLCESCPGFAHLENGDEHSAVEWLCRNTHLKAENLKVPHCCDSSHFASNSLGRNKDEGSKTTQEVHSSSN
jgi:radical SAM protein with 4Fe4S-binding SPASM domain